MSDKMNVLAPVVSNVEVAAAKYEGKYVLDVNAYQRVLDLYQNFNDLVDQNDGKIQTIRVDDLEAVRFTALVPSMDLFRESLSAFLEMLTMISSIDISGYNEDYLSVEIGTAGIWKAV